VLSARCVLKEQSAVLTKRRKEGEYC